MVQNASAQIYDADGLYVDTVFHDHINRQADDFVIVSLCVADPTTWQQDMLGTNGHAWLRLQLRYDIGCYTEQRIVEFAKQIKDNIKVLLSKKDI